MVTGTSLWFGGHRLSGVHVSVPSLHLAVPVPPWGLAGAASAGNAAMVAVQRARAATVRALGIGRLQGHGERDLNGKPVLPGRAADVNLGPPEHRRPACVGVIQCAISKPLNDEIPCNARDLGGGGRYR